MIKIKQKLEFIDKIKNEKTIFQIKNPINSKSKTFISNARCNRNSFKKFVENKKVGEITSLLELLDSGQYISMSPQLHSKDNIQNYNLNVTLILGFSIEKNIWMFFHNLFLSKVFKENLHELFCLHEIAHSSIYQIFNTELMTKPDFEIHSDFFSLYIILSKLKNNEDRIKMLKDYLTLRKNEVICPDENYSTKASILLHNHFVENINNFDDNLTYIEVDLMAHKFQRNLIY